MRSPLSRTGTGLLAAALSLFLALGAAPSDAAPRGPRPPPPPRAGGGGPRPPPPRTSVNPNVHVNHNVHVNRSVHVDVDRHYGPRPLGVAVGAAAAAVVVGSIVYSLPSSCQAVVRNGLTYHQCGSSWYQPQYSGTQVTYAVVNPPG